MAFEGAQNWTFPPRALCAVFCLFNHDLGASIKALASDLETGLSHACRLSSRLFVGGHNHVLFSSSLFPSLPWQRFISGIRNRGDETVFLGCHSDNLADVMQYRTIRTDYHILRRIDLDALKSKRSTCRDSTFRG